jgi:hypothetical protein
MANEARNRQSRQPATPQNSATMGVILVVAAVVIALLLFNAGGGGSTSTDSGKTAAEVANGDKGTTTSSTPPAPATTPPASLTVVVGNGSGVTGRAKTVSEKLSAVGYTTIKFADGTATPNTIIYFAAGHDADALYLAQTMGYGTDRVQPLEGKTPLKTADPTAVIVVLVGADLDPATATFTPPTSAPTN